MTFKISDLTQALARGNLARIEEILEQRDERTGRPLVDINNIDEHAFRTALNHITACDFFKISSQARYDIALHILGIIDNQGNPVIDLNAPSIRGSTSLDRVLSSTVLLPEHRRSLADRIINLRRRGGSRVFQMKSDGEREGISLREKTIVKAIYTQDSFIVNALADLRSANGSRVININTKCDKYVKGTAQLIHTPLDFTHYQPEEIIGGDVHFRLAPNFQPNQEIVDIIRANGGLRYGEIERQERQERLRPIPPPRNQQAVVEADEKLNVAEQQQPRPVLPNQNQQAFAADSQNVHNANVEASVDKSLQALLSMYKAPLTAKQAFNEVYTYLNHSSFNTQQKQLIVRGLKFLEDVPFSAHALTNLDLKEVLALCWTAASDPTAPDPSNPSFDPNTLVRHRRDAILEQILASETTYPSSIGDRSCIGGYRNRLVNSLNNAHECVHIIQLGTELQSTAVDTIKFYIHQNFKKLPLPQQKAVLRSWNAMSDLEGDEKEKSEQNAAFDFHKQHRNGIRERIKVSFNLSQKQFNDLFSDAGWFSFPPPSVHKQLDALFEDFFKLTLPKGIFQTKLRTRMENLVKNVYSDNRSYEEDYTWFKARYQSLRFTSTCLEILENSPPYFAALKAQIEQNIDSEEFNIVGQFKELKAPESSFLLTCANIALCVPILGWAMLLLRYIFCERAFLVTQEEVIYEKIQSSFQSSITV